MVLSGGYIVDRIGTRKGIFIFGTLCMIGAVITLYANNSWLQTGVVGLVNIAVPVVRLLGHIPLISRIEFVGDLAYVEKIQTANGAFSPAMPPGLLVFAIAAESLTV